MEPKKYTVPIVYEWCSKLTYIRTQLYGAQLGVGKSLGHFVLSGSIRDLLSKHIDCNLRGNVVEPLSLSLR